jgi:hypothetical protein
MATRKLKLSKVRKAIAEAYNIGKQEVPAEIVNEWQYYLAAA